MSGSRYILPSSLSQDTTSELSQDSSGIGCRVLWVKVIVRAVYDWVMYRDHPQMHKEAEDAGRWLFEKNKEGENSFENICFLLNLPAEKIRTWASSLSKDQVAKIEFLDGREPVAEDMWPRNH